MRFKHARIASIGAVVLAGAFLTAAVCQDSPVRASPAPPAPREEYAIQIRTQLGFESDLPYIRSLEAKPGLNVTELGTPVMASELAQVATSDPLCSQLDAVRTARSPPPSLCGSSVKPAGHGVACP